VGGATVQYSLPLGNSLPETGASSFQGEAYNSETPQLFTVGSRLPGKRWVYGSRSYYEISPYFAADQEITCNQGVCGGSLAATLYSKFGNVKGAVVLEDGTPVPWIVTVHADPVSVPLGLSERFDPTSVSTTFGKFSFAFSSVGPPPNYPPCIASGVSCEFVSVSSTNNWGLRVLGDGGVRGRDRSLYSNTAGSFTWNVWAQVGDTTKTAPTVVQSNAVALVHLQFRLEDGPGGSGEVKKYDPPGSSGGGSGGGGGSRTPPGDPTGTGKQPPGPGGSPERDNGVSAASAGGVRGEAARACESGPHPVHLATGNVFLNQVDATLPGLRTDLVFPRSYSTARTERNTVLGRGWNHGWDKRIQQVTPYTLDLTESDAGLIMYTDPDEDGVFRQYMAQDSPDTIQRTADGYVRTFRNGGVERYRSDGRLTARVDRLGRTTTLSYDGQGKLTEIVSAEGRTLKLQYNPSGKLQRLVGAQGTLAEYSYNWLDGADRLSRVRYTDGTGYAFTYDTSHRLLVVSDLAGVVLDRHAYGADGKPIWTELNAGQERYQYLFEPGKTTVTDARGAVTVTEWEQTQIGPQITKVSGCGFCGSQSGTRSWEYDYRGRIAKYTDAENQETVFTYDGSRLVSITNPLNQTTRFGGHDEYGRISTITKPGWGTTSFAYAPEGVATVTLAGGQTTTYTYDNGKLAIVRSPGGLVTQYEANDLGQLLSVTDPRGKKTTYSYDERGGVKTVTAPGGATTTIASDSQGRVRSVTRPDGQATLYGYDASGRIAFETDGAGRATRLTYDAFGRLETQVDPMGGITRLAYDSLSNLASITDAKGQKTSYSYDDLGRMTRMTDPMGGFEEYEYYPSGLLRAKVDRRRIRTDYGYDVLGRLTSKTYSDGTPPVSVTFDDAARRVITTNGADTLTWQHDVSGRLVSEHSTRNGTTVALTYDDDDERLSVSLDGALIAQYGYELGLPKWIQSGVGRFQFGYDDLGRRTSLTRPNGLSTTYTFEPLLGWLSSIRDTVGSSTVSSVTYSHDVIGDRLTKVTADWAETYSYDLLSRLTGAKREPGGATTGDWSFGYDAVGNRLTDRVSGTSRTYSYDGRNRLLGVQPGGTLNVAGSTNEVANVKVDGQPATALPGKVFEKEIAAPGGTRTFALEATDPSGNTRTNTYQVSATAGSAMLTYDENGNLTAKVDGSGTWVYEWNAENQLTRVNKDEAEVARFEYDPVGRRVRKVAGAVTHAYAYDGEDILREMRTDGATTTTYTYIHGPGIDEPLVRVAQGGSAAFYHADGLGSIVKLTDGAGQVVASHDYDAWGNLIPGSATPDPFGFTAREWNAETASYYYRARYYDPKLGRFISEDPIGLLGGMNFYVYVGARPTLLGDPFGLYHCFYYIQNHIMVCEPQDSRHPWFQSYNLTSGQNGPEEIDASKGKSYSRCDDCQDNPRRTNRAGRGPIPEGDYTIGPQGANPRRPSWRPILPHPYPRTDFYTHLCDNRSTCSEGCIAFTSFADFTRFNQLLDLEPNNTLTVRYGGGRHTREGR
jgi:RHS repeat-associated protein